MTQLFPQTDKVIFDYSFKKIRDSRSEIAQKKRKRNYDPRCGYIERSIIPQNNSQESQG